MLYVNIVVIFLWEKGYNCYEIESRNQKKKCIGKIVNKVKINICKYKFISKIILFYKIYCLKCLYNYDLYC